MVPPAATAPVVVQGHDAGVNVSSSNNGIDGSTPAHGISSSLHPPPPAPGVYPASPFGRLPDGWQIVASKDDGRIYYWERGTNKTSWVHPCAPDSGFDVPPPPPMDGPKSKWKFLSPSSLFGRDRYPAPPPYYAGSRQGAGVAPDNWMDTPLNARRRPENHQCYAVTALFLFPPLGLCACFQSWRVDQAWHAGRYGDAVNHSRQASNYACFGTLVGVAFWFYFFFLRVGSRWDLPDWRFD